MVGISNALTARITILCPEIPYPPTHGGRTDRWNRIVALREMGAAVQVVLWERPYSEQSEAASALQRIGCNVIRISRRRRIRDYLFQRYPGRLYSYWPGGIAFETLYKQVEAFSPKAILSDGLDPMITAKELAAKLTIPLAYRSQNVEHLYMRFQLELARGPGRIPLMLVAPKLELAERELRRSVQLILDISEDDRSWWQDHGGAGRSVIVPPIWRFNKNSQGSQQVFNFDVAFTGGLFAPNSVEGLEWFADLVLPSLHTASACRPRVVFAGSKPTRLIQRLCRRHGITCAADPVSLEPFLFGSRVLINPVQHSSGVNIKMLEMLATNRPIVSTLQGVRGLPEVLRTMVDVCHTPDEFAKAIIHHLQHPRLEDIASRKALLESECGPSVLEPLIAIAH